MDNELILDNELGNSVVEPVWRSACHTVKSLVSDAVWNRVAIAVWTGVWNTAGGVVYNRIWEELND